MAESTSRPSKDQKPPRGLHSAEVFGEEIEELERTTVTNWSTWLAGVGAFALLAGVVLMVMAYEARTRRGPAVTGNLPSVRLLEPSGTLDHLPARFRWEGVSGTESYLVTIQTEDTGDVLVLRASRGTSLAATAEDLARFAPGEYHWTVEARGADGKTRAWGEGSFSVAVGAP